MAAARSHPYAVGRDRTGAIAPLAVRSFRAGPPPTPPNHLRRRPRAPPTPSCTLDLELLFGVPSQTA